MGTGSSGVGGPVPRRAGALDGTTADLQARVARLETLLSIKPPASPPAAAFEVFKADAVRAAVKHAWLGWRTHAYGFDELRPLSRSGVNTFGGAGATAVDSLSTLWLVGLKDEFADARAWVAQKDYSQLGGNLFETTIRIVGGLLSAGALSGDVMFFEKARTVAGRMTSSFGTPTGIPCNAFPDATGCGRANLAEAGTLTLEFAYLSHVTKDPLYRELAERTVHSLVLGRKRATCQLDGLYSNDVSTLDGSGACEGAMGGGADSFYEYLLKMYLLTGDVEYRTLWLESMDGLKKHLVRCSIDGIPFLANNHNGARADTLEHLACFAPGMLALGDWPNSGALALGLIESCVALYTSTRSGLGADGMHFHAAGGNETACLSDPKGHEANRAFSLRSPHSLQRPEVVESLFYAYRFTKDPYYRDLGWRIFVSIENHTRVEAGYASSSNVDVVPPVLDDLQQSFFLAETLKYLFLLFSDDSVMDLSKWVRSW